MNITTHAMASPLSEPAPATNKPNDIANKENFLQLLVAQIKNQNPLNPADGVEFLTQLSQFTEMEQMLGMRQDIASIRKVVETQTTSPAPKES